jgi:transposase
MHVAQSYYMKFEIDMAEIPKNYASFDLGLAKIITCQDRWFTIMNNLALEVKKELVKAKEEINKDGQLYIM